MHVCLLQLLDLLGPVLKFTYQYHKGCPVGARVDLRFSHESSYFVAWKKQPVTDPPWVTMV